MPRQPPLFSKVLEKVSYQEEPFEKMSSSSEVSSVADLMSNTQIEADDEAERIICALVSQTKCASGAVPRSDPYLIGFWHYIQWIRFCSFG